MRLARNAAWLPSSTAALIAALGPSSCVSAQKPDLVGADSGVGGSAGQAPVAAAGSSGAPAAGGSAGMPGTGGAIDPGVGGAPVGCGADEFQCGSGECIPQSQVCDHLSQDCADGSDESAAACSGSGGTGGAGACEFQCGSGECIPMSQVCDRLSADCADGSDEDPALCNATGSGGAGSGGTGAGGTGGTQAVCPDGRFACSDGTCIDWVLVCDQTDHCPDAGDETQQACDQRNTGGATGSGGTGDGGTGTGGVVGTGGIGTGGVVGAGGSVGTGGDSSGGYGGAAGSAGAGTGGDEGYTPCVPTLTIVNGQSGPLGTGEVCAEMCNQTFMRLHTSNFGTAGAPRTMVANGVPVDCPVSGECNWSAAAPPRINGCYYFEISAGQPADGSFYTSNG